MIDFSRKEMPFFEITLKAILIETKISQLHTEAPLVFP